MESDMRSLVAAIDEELRKLEQARNILAGHAASGQRATSAKNSNGRKKPELSAAGRARIAAAQRKRWAEHRKAARKQSATKS